MGVVAIRRRPESLPRLVGCRAAGGQLAETVVTELTSRSLRRRAEVRCHAARNLCSFEMIDAKLDRASIASTQANVRRYWLASIAAFACR